MVQPDDERRRCLDDAILQVFEQAEAVRSAAGQFYFPVTSQKEARAFVRELHERGVEYPSICAAVGEFEHNFTSWRTGLGRPGIGNRVLERINRPLQELLLLAADDVTGDVVNGLGDVVDDDDVLKQFGWSLSPQQPPTPVKASKRISPRASPCRNRAGRTAAEQSRDDQRSVSAAQTTTTTTTTTRTRDSQLTKNSEDTSSSQTAEHHLQLHDDRPTNSNGVEMEENNNKSSSSSSGKPEPDILMSDVNQVGTSHKGNEDVDRPEKAEVTETAERGDKDVVGLKVEEKNNKNISSSSGIPEPKVLMFKVDQVEMTRRTGNEDVDRPEEAAVTEAAERGHKDVVSLEVEEENNKNISLSSGKPEPDVLMTHVDQVGTRHNEDVDRPEVAEVTEAAETGDKDVVDSAEDGEVMKDDGKGEVSRCSWVTELSVQLTTADTDGQTSSEPRQISVTSASASTSASELPPLHSDNTRSTSTATTTTTASSSSVLHLDTAYTDPPEVINHVTSQPEIQTIDRVDDSAEKEVVSDAEKIQSQTTASDVPIDEASATKPSQPEVNGHVTLQPEPETIVADVVDSSPKPVVVSDSEKVTSQATVGDELTSSTPEDDDATTTRPEVTSSSEKTSQTGRQGVLRKRPTKDDGNVDDVDENYDSDDDCTKDMNIHEGQGRRGGCRDGRKRWGRRYEDDGPGYVYVFTDTPPADSLTRCRVKISASRRPEARLRQARLFNVDMRLVNAVRVTRRLAAACLLRQKLVDSAIPTTLDWFNTSLDVVVNGVMDVARVYAPTTADH